MDCIGLDLIENLIKFGLQGKGPDVSKSLVLRKLVALDAMYGHRAAIMDFSKGPVV